MLKSRMTHGALRILEYVIPPIIMVWIYGTAIYMVDGIRTPSQVCRAHSLCVLRTAPELRGVKYQQQRGLINKFKHAVIEHSIVYLPICSFTSTCVVVVVV